MPTIKRKSGAKPKNPKNNAARYRDAKPVKLTKAQDELRKKAIRASTARINKKFRDGDF